MEHNVCQSAFHKKSPCAKKESERGKRQLLGLNLNMGLAQGKSLPASCLPCLCLCLSLPSLPSSGTNGIMQTSCLSALKFRLSSLGAARTRATAGRAIFEGAAQLLLLRRRDSRRRFCRVKNGPLLMAFPVVPYHCAIVICSSLKSS